MKVTTSWLYQARATLIRLREAASKTADQVADGQGASPGLLALAYVTPALVVAITTVILVPLQRLVANELVAMIYVLTIIVVSDLGPTRGWWVAPVSAAVAFDYFFTQPFFTLWISAPRDIGLVALMLVVGLVSSRQVQSLRRRTREAEERQRDLRLLNALSTALVLSVTTDDMAQSLREALASVGVLRVVLFVVPRGSTAKSQMTQHGDEPTAEESSLAQLVRERSKAVGIPRLEGGRGTTEPWPLSMSLSEAGVTESTAVLIPLVSSRRLEGVMLADAGPERAEILSSEARLIVSAANMATTFLERRELEREANAAALMRESERIKSSLFSAVSHDVKTPLAAAKAHVTNLLVEDEEAGSAHADDLLAAADALDRLAGLIDDLLDLSRLESDGWRPAIEPCEPGEIVSAALARLDLDRSRVHVKLGAAPAAIDVDFRQMERALANLVQNALLYSAGEVLIEVWGDDDAVRISVADQGPGVTDAEKARVFGKFYRGPASSEAPGGSGLGLAIVRQVVLAHGGQVRVEDVEPHGARFVIELPRANMEEQPKGQR